MGAVIIGSTRLFRSTDEGSPRDIAQQSIYTHKLGNETVTKADGKRYLVNEGTEGGEFLLQSGQGLRFDGTNAISNIGTLDLTSDFTILWDQEKTAELGQHGSHSPDAGSYFGFDSNGLSVGIGAGWKSISIAGQIGKIFSFFIRYTASTKLVEFGTLDLTLRDSYSAGNYSTLLPMDLGHIANNAIVAFGMLNNFYHLPKIALTDQQLTMYRQSPELLLHKKAGTLQSGILNRVTLDLLDSSGCWLPLCENLDAGSAVYDMSKSTETTHAITGYVESMRTNAEMLSTGLQQALVETDGIGVIIGLQSKDNLKLDGKAYIDLLQTPLGNTWCLDVYASSREIPQTGSGRILDATCFNVLAVETGKIEIGVTDLSSALYVKANADIFPLAIEQGVISFEAVNGTVSVYAGGTLEGTATTSFDNVELNTLGGILASLVHGTVAGFRISNAVRTEEERLTAVSAIEATRNLPQFDSYSVLTIDGYEILTTDGYTVATLAG